MRTASQSPTKNTLTNTASFLKDITDGMSYKSTKSHQSSPLRQAILLEDASSPPPTADLKEDDDHDHDRLGRTGSTTSSSEGKSTIRSFDAKSTHESSDDSSSFAEDDPNEDLSVAEPTQTIIDPMSFYTARGENTPPLLGDSTGDSYRTAKFAQTPHHPNGSRSSLSGSEGELKSRSVRFAPPDNDDGEEQSFAFDFTPQLPIQEPQQQTPEPEHEPVIERPATPPQQVTSSTKNTPHSSPLKLFSRYDTFTNERMGQIMSNLLPGPDDEETDELRNSRAFKRARREATSRERVPRIPPSARGEIRGHTRMPSLTTQEMFDDAEDFMRDLRSMPRPGSVENNSEHAIEEESTEQRPEEEVQEEEEGGEYFVHDEEYADEDELDDEGNISSEFEECPQSKYSQKQVDDCSQEYSTHSSSHEEPYDSIRQAPSPSKLSLSPSKLPLSPSKHSPVKLTASTAELHQPPSRVSSAESMQVITLQDVSHLLPHTIKGMQYDHERGAWFKIRPSQSHSLKRIPDEDESVEEEAVMGGADETEEDIFRDIEDLVLTDEEELRGQGDSRPSSAGEETYQSRQMVESRNETMESIASYRGVFDEERLESPGGKEGGSEKEFDVGEEKSTEWTQHTDLSKVMDQLPSPVALPQSPLRKSLSCSPLPSPQAGALSKSHLSLSSSPVRNSPVSPARKQQPASPLRRVLQNSTQHSNLPSPKIVTPSPKIVAPSPKRSPHRKTPSTDKRVRKSLPLPPLDTPEAIRQSQLHTKPPCPPKITSSLQSHSHAKERPQSTIRPLPKFQQSSTPLPKPPSNLNSPFLEPRESLRFSISPPPQDLTFTHTPAREDISFSVTTRTLVKHLTDFEPFEPYWENLLYIDFRGKNVTSLEGLKGFCPKVEELDIRDCKVRYLTGLPPSMRILKARGNRLDGLVSFAWGRNIQYLHLGDNEIDSLAGPRSPPFPHLFPLLYLQ